MKRPFKLIAALLAFCIVLAQLPTAGLAAGGTTHQVPSGTDLIDYLARASVGDGDILQLQGNVRADGTDPKYPWIIEKSVTIDGGGYDLLVSGTGIILGADVTFQNVKLGLTSTDSRNAIIANGYALTLDGVTPQSTARSINIFGGTLIKADYEDYFEVPAPGNQRTITIQGGTSLQNNNTDTLGPGNIYAGSLSMGTFEINPGPEGDGADSVFEGDVVINIEGSAGSSALGTIYAGGGQQRRPAGASVGKETSANPDKYRVDGTVTITGAKIPDIAGSGATAVNVEYSQNNGKMIERTFADISGLAVNSGYLVLENGSWFRDGGTLSLASGAKLDLSRFSDPVPSFTGEGGILILGQSQTLCISGQAAGMAQVAIGSVTSSGAGSGSPVTPEHIYITTPTSSKVDFQLLPYGNQTGMKLEMDANGAWKVPVKTEEVSKLISLAPENVQVASGTKEVFIPLNPDYTGQPLGLETLPLTLFVNGSEAGFGQDLYGDDCYKGGKLCLYIGDWGSGEGIMAYPDDNSGPPPDGRYHIAITVPGEYTQSGSDVSASCTLTVGSAAAVTEIAVNSTGHKTEYQVGDSLDVTGLTIGVTYSDNTTATVPVTQDMVKGFDSSQTADSQILTVTYGGKTTDYTIRIVPSDQPGQPKYRVTVQDTGEGGTRAGVYEYEEGSGVTVRAGSRDGYTFTGWQSTGLELAGGNSPELTFTMPGGHVVLRALWQLDSTPRPEHTHVWAPAWEHSGTHHWHNCTAANCTVTADSEKDAYAAHTAGGWVVDRPASSGQSGTRHRACTVCGFVMERETIPATGGGSSSGGSSSGGSGSSGGSSSGGSTTVKNPDGSVTVTTTNRNTGAVTETTRHSDGSKTVVETQKDGTVTTTNTEKDGSTVTTVERPGGRTETAVKRADGLSALVQSDRNGAQAEIRFSAQTVQMTQVGVTLPIPALPGEKADITIHTDSIRPVRVEIPVEGSSATTVAYLVNGGVESMIKTAVLADGKIAVNVPDGAAVRLRDNSRDFSDTTNHWAKDAVAFVTARELFFGGEDSLFGPDTSMTRAMLMTVLARLDGVDAGRGEADEAGMAWAVAQGVSDGRNPEAQVNREQFVAMLYRYAGSPAASNRELHFSDVPAISDYAWDAICWAVQNGLLSGYGDGSIAPGDRMTRAQAASVLARYVKYLNQ